MSPKAPTLYDTVDKWLVRIIKWISYISAVCLVVIMLVAFLNVIGEKLHKLEGIGKYFTGIPASTEIIQYLHIPVVFLGAAYVTLDRGHTRVDLISSRLPKKAQDVCFIVGNIIGVVICAIVSWRGFVKMGDHLKSHTMSSVSGIGFPLWPFSLTLSIGFVLLTISLIWEVVRHFHNRGADDSGKGGKA